MSLTGVCVDRVHRERDSAFTGNALDNLGVSAARSAHTAYPVTHGCLGHNKIGRELSHAVGFDEEGKFGRPAFGEGRVHRESNLSHSREKYSPTPRDPVDKGNAPAEFIQEFRNFRTRALNPFSFFKSHSQRTNAAQPELASAAQESRSRSRFRAIFAVQ